MFPDVSVEARGEAAVGERVRRCVRRAVVGVREASMSCQQRNVISAWGSKSGVCNPGEEDGEGGGFAGRGRTYSIRALLVLPGYTVRESRRQERSYSLGFLRSYQERGITVRILADATVFMPGVYEEFL